MGDLRDVTNGGPQVWNDGRGKEGLSSLKFKSLPGGNDSRGVDTGTEPGSTGSTGLRRL